WLRHKTEDIAQENPPHAATSLLPHPQLLSSREKGASVTQISMERQQSEEDRKHVLAFRDPGHGFNVERVQGEKCGRDPASPIGSRGPGQKCQEKQSIEHVQYDVGYVISGGRVSHISVEKRPPGGIPLERQPGQRIPVGAAR